MKRENTMVFLILQNMSTTIFLITLPRKKAQRYFTKKAIRKVVFDYQGYIVYNLTVAYEDSKGLRKELDKKFASIAEEGDYYIPSHYLSAMKFVDMYKALKEGKKVVLLSTDTTKEEYIEAIFPALANIRNFKDRKDNRRYNMLFSVIVLFRDGFTDIRVGKNVDKDINNANCIPIVPVDKGFLEIIAAQV